MMNETIHTILNRRSIRKYTKQSIPEEILNQILLAGTYAPSAKNQQSAIILAVTNKEKRDQLSALNAKIMNVDASKDPFYGAPVVLIVLADKNNPNHVYDGSLVMQNLMLAAKSLNIGSCWIHRAKEMFETQEGKTFLKQHHIPDHYEGIGNCILGYFDEPNPKAAPRKENSIYWIR